MDTASISANTGFGQDAGISRSFREADFLAVMLTEVTNQDPMNPTETAKMVENMQRLQELANTQYEKFRDDLRWAQELVGESITVQQADLNQNQIDSLRERGVDPDVGYGQVSGTVENYRVVGESVWLTVGGREYPIDNLQRLGTSSGGDAAMVSLADGLIGRRVTWYDGAGDSHQGRVDDVTWTDDGAVSVWADGQAVPFEAVRGIGAFAGEGD